MLCNELDFPFTNVYSTKLDLDKYSLSLKNIKRLKKIKEELSSFPLIKIHSYAKSLNDFSFIDKKIINRLDKLFNHTKPISLRYC